MLCELAESCEDFTCAKIHPPKRRSLCFFREKCINVKCKALHPSTRPEVCPRRSECKRFACCLLHGNENVRRCKFRDSCRNQDCRFLHPDEDCPNSELCNDRNCPFRHPLMCKHGIKCKDESCDLQHPAGWDPLNEFPGILLKTYETRTSERNTTRQLPIYKCYDEILDRLDRHKVLIVTAETGAYTSTINIYYNLTKILHFTHRFR